MGSFDINEEVNIVLVLVIFGDINFTSTIKSVLVLCTLLNIPDKKLIRDFLGILVVTIKKIKVIKSYKTFYLI